MGPEESNFLIVSVTIAILILVAMMIFLVTYIQKKRVQFLLIQKEIEANYEEQLLHSQIEIAEQTLKHISWELHDNIGQLLTVASMEVKMKKDKYSEDQELEKVISTALKEVRALSKSLNTSSVEQRGLIQSLNDEVSRISRMHLKKITCESINLVHKLTKEEEIIIFRMIQECISNSLRHSEAQEISIHIEETAQDLKVVIEDNGKGFELNKSTKGIGNTNLRERAKVIGAVIDINSTINKGTSIKITKKHKSIIEKKV